MEALTAFQSYKAYYADQIVPLLTEQKLVEMAIVDVEAKADLDAQVFKPPYCQPYATTVACNP